MSDDDDKKAATVKPFAAAGRGKPCPMCGKPAQVETRPFCSKRCADLDLGRWLGEEYRIPAVELDDADLEELEKAIEEQGSKGEKGA